MTTKAKTETAQDIFNAGKEQIESAVQASAQAARKNMEQTMESTRKQFEEASKHYGDFAVFGRENMEACVAASTAAAKGVEAINAELFKFSKGIYEANLAAYKSFSGIKSPKEFFEINNDLVKSRYEDAVSEVNKLNDIATSTANDVVAPINARMSDAAERFTKGLV